jgi:hypothetical protein
MLRAEGRRMSRDGRIIRNFGALLAPVLACVAVPSTKTVTDTSQPVRDAPDLPKPGLADLPKSEVPIHIDVSPMAVAEFSADPPGEPRRGVVEGLAPKKTHVKSFTRRIERTRIEARGTTLIKTGFHVALQAAAFDNDAWRGDQRRELLAYLRGDAARKGAEFTKDDARIIARLQSGSGAPADGELRDETMAVLFAMGFHFSARRVTPWELKLEFYPGEVEDLDAWNREIDEKVTKNGGDYRDLNAPDGEGTIYVYVGRSIVASYRARGGPPSPVADEGQHVAGPTKPGIYRLGTGHAHVTSNWYYSQIPWGAEIRENAGGYQYRWPGRSEWSWATSNPAGKLKLPLAIDAFEDLPTVTRDGVTFLIWNKNDFGPIAWNLVPSDMYIHTTPDAEPGAEPDDSSSDTEASLPVSHGCIHIYPHDRDEMMRLGYLGPNVEFVVRRWDEHLLPDQVRHEMLGRRSP